MRFSERQAGGELLKLCGHTDKLIMMGQHDRSEALFYYFRLEDHVLETHLLRLIEKHISFAFVREKLKESYSDTVRPSIDPELLLRIHLLRPSCHLHFSLAARRRTIHSGWPTTDSAIGTGAAGGLKGDLEFSALVVVIRSMDHLPRTRGLSRTGKADQIAIRVREVRDHEVFPRVLHWTHHARPPEALGLLERDSDVGNADVEDRMAGVARASTYAARNPDPVVSRITVHEPVITSEMGSANGALVSNFHPNRSP